MRGTQEGVAHLLSCAEPSFLFDLELKIATVRMLVDHPEGDQPLAFVKEFRSLRIFNLD